MFQTKVVEKIKTHFMFNNFFSSENRAVCEIMWENTAQRDRTHVTIWRMCIACWIPKATYTHTHTHTHTHTICNTDCCSTATVVRRTRLNVVCALPVLFHRPISREGWSPVAFRHAVFFSLPVFHTLPSAPCNQTYFHCVRPCMCCKFCLLYVVRSSSKVS